MDVRIGLCRGSAAAQERCLIDSDEAMARRIAAGDADAWDLFFDRFSPWAYRFACRHLDGNRADAEDLCSEIMMTAAKSISGFDPRRGDLDLWVHGLARHRLAHFCRRRRIELPLIPEIVDAGCGEAIWIDDPAGSAHTKDAVNRALACLTQRQASLLIGKYVEGYTTEELARGADMTPKAVESALARARSAFRSAFTELMAGTEGVGTRG